MARRDEPYRQRNRATLLVTGAAYFERMEVLIDGARRSVHLQVYIFADDTTGSRMAAALMRAAQRGVQVFLLADGYASHDLPDTLISRLRASGVHFRWFQPLWLSRRFYFGRRLHHKVLVVDHRAALVSGRNIADRYNDLEGQPAWLDVALEVEGEVVLDLSRSCCRVWNGWVDRDHRVIAVPPTDAECAELSMNWPEDRACSIRMRFNDRLYGHAQITVSYMAMFREARSEIQLMASYFVPSGALKRAMAGAARRGVHITVIMAGRSDVWIAKLAERWLYAWLLRMGVQVYEYEKAMLHAKVAVCDGAWCTLGSFNLNDLSNYTTLELNLDVADAPLAAGVRAVMDRTAREDCRRITAADLRHAGPLDRFAQWCAYRALRLLHRVFTFYYRRER